MLKKWLLLMSVMIALPAAAQDISASNPQLETISGTVVAQGAPDSHPAILGEVLRYACSVPLISRNRVLGVMELRREDYGFTQENANFLMQIANHVASRLKRPRI